MAEEVVSRLGLHSWSETLQERTIHFQVLMQFINIAIISTLLLMVIQGSLLFPKNNFYIKADMRGWSFFSGGDL